MDYREPLKCKICGTMLKGGDDHYCIPCVEHLEAVIDVLKERNAALKELVREIANAELGQYPQFYLYLVSEWKDKAKALLDYPATPPDAKPEMVLVRKSDLDGLIAAEDDPRNLIVVRREDLEKAIDFMQNTAGTYWIEVCNRLKAALGGEK